MKNEMYVILFAAPDDIVCCVYLRGMNFDDGNFQPLLIIHIMSMTLFGRSDDDDNIYVMYNKNTFIIHIYLFVSIPSNEPICCMNENLLHRNDCEGFRSVCVVGFVFGRSYCIQFNLIHFC